jgi:hypothetical protein
MKMFIFATFRESKEERENKKLGNRRRLTSDIGTFSNQKWARNKRKKTKN